MAKPDILCVQVCSYIFKNRRLRLTTSKPGVNHIFLLRAAMYCLQPFQSPGRKKTGYHIFNFHLMDKF